MKSMEHSTFFLNIVVIVDKMYFGKIYIIFNKMFFIYMIHISKCTLILLFKKSILYSGGSTYESFNTYYDNYNLLSKTFTFKICITLYSTSSLTKGFRSVVYRKPLVSKDVYSTINKIWELLK